MFHCAVFVQLMLLTSRLPLNLFWNSAFFYRTKSRNRYLDSLWMAWTQLLWGAWDEGMRSPVCILCGSIPCLEATPRCLHSPTSTPGTSGPAGAGCPSPGSARSAGPTGGAAPPRGSLGERPNHLDTGPAAEQVQAQELRKRRAWVKMYLPTHSCINCWTSI